jgi:hypothetical protein
MALSLTIYNLALEYALLLHIHHPINIQLCRGESQGSEVRVMNIRDATVVMI